MAGEEDQIQHLFEFLNPSENSLKFTVKMGGISSCFLDLEITIDNTKALVYSKPTDNHFYLNGNSCHLTKSINRISTLVANRLRRICSNDSDSQEQSKKYSAACNHKPKDIVKGFKTTSNQSRSAIRRKHTKDNIKSVTVYYIPIYYTV